MKAKTSKEYMEAWNDHIEQIKFINWDLPVDSKKADRIIEIVLELKGIVKEVSEDIYGEKEAELIHKFEDESGLDFDPDGPLPSECEYCSKLLQFIPDHDCYGTRGEAGEARLQSEYELDYYSGNE